jgi:hypothetical protein
MQKQKYFFLGNAILIPYFYSFFEHYFCAIKTNKKKEKVSKRKKNIRKEGEFLYIFATKFVIHKKL